jgi:hypothetical protein
MSDGQVDAKLDAWWTQLLEALDLAAVPVERDAILGLAGEAAHAVVRPAAPLTTFLVGYAAGRAGGSAEAIADAVARARAATRE